ncbi:MAG: HD-GYP domain-containing protein [Negativicutes bacterium]|nr:HD-GYP domain-containing protein [Negativicutes bacterium]
MQRISMTCLRAGMVVANNICAADGTKLMSAGTTLTPKQIFHLNKLGVGSVYVENPLFGSLEVPEVVREDTRITTIQALQKAVAGFGKTGEFELDDLKKSAKAMVSEVILNRDSMVHFLDMRSHEDYLFGHSVNVCILSILTALNMNFNEARLTDLALGTLIHDVGMTTVPKEILLKVGALSAQEAQEVQKHAENGFDIVRKIRDLSTPSAHVAFQHHERFDGKGYPRGLKGDEIHEFARIATVADIYDALSSDRPYRKGMLPHVAYETLMTLADKYVDRDILHLFLANVAIYPVGTTVQINTGEYGLVTEVLPKLQARPTIKIFTDRSGNLLEDTQDVVLTEHLTRFITKVLKDSEMINLTRPFRKDRQVV